MADKVSRFAPTGSMDKDSDPRYVGKGDSNGDYIDARNIQCVPQDGNENGSISPTLGNEFAFSLGSVSQQNKRYRLTFDGNATKQHELRFLSTNRDANIVTGTGTNGAVTFNGTQANFLSQFSAANSGSGVSFLITTPTSNTVEIELTLYPMYQWYLENVGPNDINSIVIAEAIPADLAGPLKDIGSYDLLGDLLIFSTTQDNEPTELPITITAMGPTLFGGTIAIGPITYLTFSAPHGMVQGQWIRISSSLNSWLNGLFLVSQVLSPTQIGIPTVLAWGGTLPQVATGPEVITVSPNGIGDIGVAQKNENADSWTYTRLLRSVELNFVSKWQVDCFAKNTAGNISSYFLDNYNNPRRFIYAGPFVQDGAVMPFSPLATYIYDNIFEGISLQFSNTPSLISLLTQNETGGKLTTGIKYYITRQISKDNSVTKISSLSHPVLVSRRQSLGGIFKPHFLGGASAEIETTKCNILKIENLLPSGVYPRTEIIYLSLNEGVYSASLIHSFTTPNEGSYVYVHTGNEEITTVIDIAEVIASAQERPIVRAKNIREIDQRNTISNGSLVSDIDMTVFAKSFKHGITFKTFDEESLTSISEFKDPLVMKDSLGLMINENVRVGFRAFVKGIGWTDYYHIDDIKIDDDPINQANLSDNRRLFGLPDKALSEIDAQQSSTIPFAQFEAIGRLPSLPYNDTSDVMQSGYIGTRIFAWSTPFFSGRTDPYQSKYKYRSPQLVFFPDWSVLIPIFGGVPAGEIIELIEFGIADVPNSVKASGMAIASVGIPQSVIPTVGMGQTQSANVFEFPDIDLWVQKSLTNAALFNYPFINHPTTSPSTDYIQEMEQRRDVVSFYSPDYLIEGGYNAAVLDSSSIEVLGSLETIQVLTTLQNNRMAAVYSLVHPSGPEYASPSSSFDIVDSTICEDIDVVAFTGGDNYQRTDNPTQFFPGSNVLFPDGIFTRPGTPVFKLSSPIPAVPETSITKQFRGLFYAQAYKDESINFIDKTLNTYTKIGETIKVNPQMPSLTVNGGDTYTSLFYFRKRPSFIPNGTQVNITGALYGMLCQSRTNPRMMTSEGDIDQDSQYPIYPVDYFKNGVNLTEHELQLRDWSELDGGTFTTATPAMPIIRSRTIIDSSFNAMKIPSLFSTQSFNYALLAINSNARPTRIWWSEKTLYGELSDAYRMFLLLNYKDLDRTFGEITHHESVNGELFTLQQRKWQRQLFNTRGELQVTGSSIGAIIGDGSVLSRDGQTLSSYGSSNKWSCQLGKSQGGSDVLYWYNSENGLFMRFGADGTIVLSNSRKMRNFSRSVSKWVHKKDAPAFEQGVRAVWDDRSKETIWTFTGWRDLPEWLAIFTEVGEVVKNSNAPSDSYEGFPRFFKCKLVHIGSSLNEPGVGTDWETYWEQIPYDDIDYYSIFTLAHNEATNGFSTFYGHIPKTYLKWRDTFLSSHPTQRNLIFEHRKGEPTTWYGVDSFLTGIIPPKIEDAFIEAVFNDLPEESKRFVSNEVLSDNVPDKIEYRTKSQYTWSEPADFKVNDDQFRGFILNDATVSQDPRGNTRRMDGDYIKAKFIFIGGTMNRLYSMVVKLRGRLRDFRR